MKRIAVIVMLAMVLVTAGSRVTTARTPPQPTELLQLLPDGNILAVVDVQKLIASSLALIFSRSLVVMPRM